MKQCRVCGYNSKASSCPHCGCNVMIDKNNYDWAQTSASIKWKNVKVKP